MEAIVAAVTERRAIPPALAYIDTPTHVHVVPSGCMSAQPQPEEAAAEAMLIPTQASLLRSVQEMLLN